LTSDDGVAMTSSASPVRMPAQSDSRAAEHGGQQTMFNHASGRQDTASRAGWFLAPSDANSLGHNTYEPSQHISLGSGSRRERDPSLSDVQFPFNQSSMSENGTTISNGLRNTSEATGDLTNLGKMPNDRNSESTRHSDQSTGMNLGSITTQHGLPAEEATDLYPFVHFQLLSDGLISLETIYKLFERSVSRHSFEKKPKADNVSATSSSFTRSFLSCIALPLISKGLQACQ